MQHDCGHRSLWPHRWQNDFCGRAIAVYTGIAYDAWRTEHDWHHQVTGRMDRRGIDRFNSPMTADEARADLVRARAFQHKVKAWRIAWLGMLSLLLERRRPQAFFMFRPGFVWRFDRDFIVRALHVSNALHVAWHAALIAWLGLPTWLAVVAGYVVSGFIGAVTFWVQHNFEHAVLRPGERWSFVEAALRGSSYLRLPQPLRWFTADIGVHHVHHLNAHIPHHRLERTRRALPELAAIAPLSLADLQTAFTHHYFDEQRGRRISWHELQHGVATDVSTSAEDVAAEYA
jgi:omega-6 fatty acid desaturase (delta-12 desaturase)